jgi:hypothetical protein
MDHPSENHNNGSGHETREVSVPFVFASLTAAKEAVQQIPPTPRIEEHPAEQLQSIHAREDHVLSTYALIDKDRGIVRVPIDKAIDMLAAKGVPTHNYLDDITAGKKPSAPPAAKPPASPQGSSNAQ